MLSCLGFASFMHAANGDTTKVNVFDKFHMSRYGNFDQKVKLPAPSFSSQRIWLKYTLGCTSNGQCEWDYTIKLFVREHTGKNDSTLKQAPYLKVNGASVDSVKYAQDTTWVNVFNQVTKQTDSVPAATINITLFGDSTQPLKQTASIMGFAANYWRVNFDSTGARTDSVFVPSTQVIRQKFTPYYDVFEVVNNIELGRFISPYAKTFPKSFQYDYIYDVTDYAGLLHDSAEFRIEYQGYSYGFTATWNMMFVEGTPARDVIKVENVYNGGYDYGQANSIETALNARNFTVPANASAVKARIIITGHGGESNENCAEFCPKTMYLKLNGNQIAEQLVWKDDCGSNAIIAQPGTWVYNRANWCPGEKIRNFDYNLNVTPGSTNSIDLDMEAFTASGYAGYNLALQLIYYKNNNYETDAAIEEIMAPTTDFWYNRVNPICDNAKIKLKNWGSTPLMQAEISYQIGKGQVQKINWYGNLAYEKEQDITLSYMQWPSDLTDTTFKVWLSKINNADTDGNVHNNTKQSAFSLPMNLPAQFVIETFTNARPAQNSYVLKDHQGIIIRTRTFTSASTLHRDTFNLGWGCYTFEFKDEGGNGLAWWAASSEGSGYLRIRNVGTPAKIFRSFNADFGSFVQMNFTTQYPLGQSEKFVTAEQVEVYPNPATKEVNISGFEVKEVMLMDVTGRMLNVSGIEGNRIDVSNVPSGVYFLQLTNKSGQLITKKLTIAP